MDFEAGVIILEPEADSYSPGQDLRGKFRFRLDNVKTFRGIYVQVLGYAQVNWISHHSQMHEHRLRSYYVNPHLNRANTRNRFGYEEYLQMKEYLIGGSEGEYHLQPGNHEFLFQFHIPENCPSSFSCIFGQVLYKVKVVMDLSFLLNPNKERIFTVKAPLNWKNTPLYREPMQLDLEATYCSWCTSAGSCETIVKAPRSSYRVGQSVPIEFSCVNLSSVTITNIKMQIVKKITLRTYHPPSIKWLEETIVEISVGTIPGRTTRNCELQMEIPIMDPCNLAGCSIIEVTFVFRVQLITAGFHLNPEQSQQIIIGDTPR